MAKAMHGVALGTPQRGKMTIREPGGRRCEASGCDTVLSTYNRALTCYTHTAPETRHAKHR